MEFSGQRQFWTGFLVCRECLDKPQAQFLTPILPGDPKPIINPRPEFFDLARGQDGLQFFDIYQPRVSSDEPVGQTKANMLAEVAILSGVPTPANPTDESGTILTAQVTQALVAANPVRQFLLIYNPTAIPFVISTGQAAFSGDPFAVLIGAGLAALMATALGNVSTGALTIAGLVGAIQVYAQQYAQQYGGIPGQAFWVFEA